MDEIKNITEALQSRGEDGGHRPPVWVGGMIFEEALARLDFYLTGKTAGKPGDANWNYPKHPEDCVLHSSTPIYLSDGGYSRIYVKQVEGADNGETILLELGSESRDEVKAKWREQLPYIARIELAMTNWLRGAMENADRAYARHASGDTAGPYDPEMTDLFPEVVSVPVLSTAHLTRLDHDLLEAHIDIDRYTKEDSTWSTDWKSPLVVLEDRSYGYWIYCGHEGLEADEDGVAHLREEMEAAGFSHALGEILTAGKEAGHTYIRFDCDGPESARFPAFQWSTTRGDNVDKLEKQLKAIRSAYQPSCQYDALINGLISKIDANADEILEAARRVELPWTYKDIPRLFVLAANAGLIKDTEFFYFDPDSDTFDSIQERP